MLAFGLTIFTGAFLLFLVQPLIARFILPWFGGTPAVWTTCMLFFQVLLVGGYAYAHWTIRRWAPRRQVIVHLALLALALLLLPITPGDGWKPVDGAFPMGRILLLLMVCLGLPYLALSATGPLMQAWFHHAHPGVPPYRLYALSNAGSLLALLGYPFVVEPMWSRQAQAWGWSAGLGGFVLLAAWCGVMVWRRARSDALGSDAPGEPREATAFAATAAVPGDAAAERAEVAPAVPEGAGSGNAVVRHRWLWVALPACGSALLLAVTNKICQDIAVIPFLWVLPLSLYLVSFIVCFDSSRWYRRWFWLSACGLGLAAALALLLVPHVVVPDTRWLRPLQWLLREADKLSLLKAIAIYLGILFAGCMVCHGEVYRLRPGAQDLTAYYLGVAVGGACGGVLVAVVAPLVFRDYFELHASLLALAVLTASVLWVDPRSPLRRARGWLAGSATVLVLGALALGFIHAARESVREYVEVTRNFYGVLKVQEAAASDPEAHELRLLHGTTTHGLQFTAPDRRRLATSYYTSASGIGLTMRHLPRREQRRIGVVGLGTGTMASWANAGDTLRIYEINQAVERLARERFTYLRDCPAQVEVILGDARLSLEREPDQAYDVLVLDAFSSDAIPVHLLTREAFAIYQRHLRADGVLVVHVSNQHLDLEPVVLEEARQIGMQSVTIRDHHESWDDESDEAVIAHAYSSDWMLLTRNEAFLKLPAIAEAAGAEPDSPARGPLWTDEQSSLLPILELEHDTWLGWIRARLTGGTRK